MLSVDYIKGVAYELASHDDSRTAHIVEDLLDLADQLNYLEERDEISDSRLQLLKQVGDTLRDEVTMLRDKLEQEHRSNIELRKQVRLLKAALINS